MKFIPEDIDDPMALYAERLTAFSERDVSKPEDAIFAFRGVLNRLTANTQAAVPLLYAMPRAFFDVSLIWWLRPDRNVDQNVERNLKFPSWSWIGWKAGRKNQFVPYDEYQVHHRKKNLEYLSNDAQNTYYWWRDHKEPDLRPVWDKALEDNSLLVADENRRIITDESKPARKWTGNPDVGMLQFQGTLLPSGQVNFNKGKHGYGIGEIKDGGGYLVGVCYADDQNGSNSESYSLIQLSKANKCYEFDSSGKLDMNVNGAKENKRSNKFSIKLPLPADGKLWWVMVVKRASFGGPNVYERVGLGWIDRDSLSAFNPHRTWIVLA
ncbi:hypothetical protein CC80DRAFT_533114 [Byssothecium circinans]|uniref:Heterokaryon incompatibility domain-containing protein n=1 Tax=Byssothecium circinans TaxID=147558 RepID=A0A6A5U4I0_9PLEO|nr:hypothetical protein CC80DRAFT_533114 [Byssothecium circinans]